MACCNFLPGTEQGRPTPFIKTPLIKQEKVLALISSSFFSPSTALVILS